MSRVLALAPAIGASLLAVAPAVHADAGRTTEPRVAVALRLGGQRAEVGGFWPSLAFFGEARLWRGLSVGIGYDYARIYPGQLCHGDVCGSPIHGASVQGGSWWTFRLSSWFATCGALLGISGPSLSSLVPHP